MTTQTTPLTDFLLARITEDEDDAHAMTEDSGALLRWTGRRVLAESAAKRRIAEAHTWTEEWDEGAPMFSDCHECWQAPPCLTILALASVYADHADYLEEWSA